MRQLLTSSNEATPKLPPTQAANVNEVLENVQHHLQTDIMPRLVGALRLIAGNPELHTAQVSLIGTAYDIIELAKLFLDTTHSFVPNIPDQMLLNQYLSLIH